MCVYEGQLTDRGIPLLQQSIDVGERSRIKWLSLPDPLNRYMFTEGDLHTKIDKSESNDKAGMLLRLHGGSNNGVQLIRSAIGQECMALLLHELRMEIYMYNQKLCCVQ